MPVGVYERRPVAERFATKVTKTQTCWLWTGGTNGRYGTMRINRRSTYAHRFSYELHVGPIPDGLEIDHLCRTPLCVNPAHLEPVTKAENLARAREYRACNSCGRKVIRSLAHIHEAVCSGQVTRCGKGHELNPENTYSYRDERRCRKCHALAERVRRARLRGER